jgi:hypothetical protein
LHAVLALIHKRHQPNNVVVVIFVVLRAVGVGLGVVLSSRDRLPVRRRLRRGGIPVVSIGIVSLPWRLRRRGIEVVVSQIDCVAKVNLCTPNMFQDRICWGLHDKAGAWWWLLFWHGCCYIFVLRRESNKQ